MMSKMKDSGLAPELEERDADDVPVQSSDGEETFVGSAGCEFEDNIKDEVEEITRPPIESRPSQPQDMISVIPDDCLSLIFRKLEPGDLARCSLVCKRWFDVDAETRTHLVLRASEQISPYLGNIITRFSGISKLVLKGERGLPSISNADLLVIADYSPQLRKLKLKNCKQITDEGLAAFAARSTQLTKFSCGACGFGIPGLSALLKSCSTLEDLTIKRTVKPSNKVTEPLDPGNVNLRRLCLKDQTDAFLWGPLLSACSRLETLILARNSGDWDSLLCVTFGTGKFEHLSQVYLEKLSLTDTGIRSLTNCPSLEALVVINAPQCSDTGLVFLSEGSPTLKRLHIESWGPLTVSNMGLRALATNCKLLQELVLVNHTVTELGLQVLVNNSVHLERLTLCNGSNLGDADIACLTTGCPNLKRLCIKGSPLVTGKGILALADGCPALRKLKIRRCPGIERSALDHLQKLRPEIQVQLHCRTESSGTSQREDSAGIVRNLAVYLPIGETNEAENEATSALNRRRLSRARNAISAGTSFMADTLRRLVGGAERRRDETEGNANGRRGGR